MSSDKLSLVVYSQWLAKCVAGKTRLDSVTDGYDYPESFYSVIFVRAVQRKDIKSRSSSLTPQFYSGVIRTTKVASQPENCYPVTKMNILAINEALSTGWTLSHVIIFRRLIFEIFQIEKTKFCSFLLFWENYLIKFQICQIPIIGERDRSATNIMYRTGVVSTNSSLRCKLSGLSVK